ncbi:MAG: hypothetical protein M3O28_01485, partial [Actinomycetota bacterium]|nr:hypothetical protein [Actinomycetota bacterium]
MTQTTMCLTVDPTALVGAPAPKPSEEHATLAIWVRQPWMVRVGRENVLIRGTSPRDFGAVAAMHARCS